MRDHHNHPISFLSCLQCAAPLSPAEQWLRCPECSAAWPVEDGIPRFASAPYFGEIPQEDLRTLNVELATRNWRQVAQEHFKNNPNSLFAYAADLNRASWTSVLPIPTSSTVLDIGSGFGTITHALALTYARVVSVEPVPERITFTKLRLRQEALDNVQLVQTTASHLPFSPKTFDLIVLNGILEWVAEWNLAGKPRDVQLAFLRQVRELLTEDGLLVVGIENRFSYGSFVGARDHSGLRFTSFLPRSLASAYLKLQRPDFTACSSTAAGNTAPTRTRSGDTVDFYPRPASANRTSGGRTPDTMNPTRFGA